MKQRLWRVAAAALAVLMTVSLCGCEIDVAVSGNAPTTPPSGSGSTVVDPWDNSTGSDVRPPASDASEYEDTTYAVRQEALDLRLTREVLDRSILYKGDIARVATFLKKVMRGEAVTIGFIGGSITQGTAASVASNKYAERFFSWFTTTFPDTTFTYVNVGLGATDSLMGVHRVDNDLLSKDPDLVIVDFTVNDPYEVTYRKSYEGLMRKILKSGAAVIGLQMMKQDGTNAANEHSRISKHYDIPTVSYKEALWPTDGDKVYTWSEISPDSIHPNDTGHAIVSELLVNYINIVRAQITAAPAPLTTLPEPATDNPYETGVLLNGSNSTPSTLTGFAVTSGTPQFPNGWYTTTGGTFVLDVEDTKNLSLLYWKQNGVSGSVTVKVDGQTVATVESTNPATWNYAMTESLCSSDTAGSHTIEITATGTFWILGILKS